MDLPAHLAALRRNWLLVVVPVVLGFVLAVVALGVQVPKYQSTAKLYVSVANAANANDLSQGSSFSQSAAANLAALAEQPYVLHAVRTRLKLPLSSDEIAAEMTTSVEEGTSIVSIDVLDRSSSRAAAIATTTADQLTRAVSVVNPVAADGTQTVRVTVVRTAAAAAAPLVPNRSLGLALGLLGGLLVGVLLIILRELLDTRLRSADELQALTGAPNVGQIPVAPSIGARPLIVLDHEGGAAAEGFRSLQLNTEYLRAPHGVAVVAVASAVPSEGKSTVAANLALALATAGHRVALVDADLRRPRLASIFGIDGGIGLTEVLVGRAELTDVQQQWGQGPARITVVPSGATPPNPGELLQSPRFREVLDGLARLADVVVVDGPPLLAVADSAVLARTADAVLLVASLRRSRRPQITQAVAALEHVGARLLGSVLTMTKPSRADSDAYLRYAVIRTSAPGTVPPVVAAAAVPTAVRPDPEPEPEPEPEPPSRPDEDVAPKKAAPVTPVPRERASRASAGGTTPRGSAAGRKRATREPLAAPSRTADAAPEQVQEAPAPSAAEDEQNRVMRVFLAGPAADARRD